MKTLRGRNTVFAIIMGLCLTSGTVAANATTDTSTQEEPSTNLVWTLDPNETSDGSPRTMAEAQTWAGCGLTANANDVVRNFPRSKVLRCGNANFGYFHIKARHEGDWQSKANMTGDNWRDVADIGIDGALQDPVVTKLRSENDTTCYSRTIFLVNRQNGQTVGSTVVRAVAGNRSNNIVTAFPSSEHCKGDE